MKYVPALFTAALLLASPALAGEVTVADSSSFETATGLTTGAAFLSLTSSEDDRLISAASPAAGEVQLHEMSDDNGIMKMRQVSGIDLPAGKAVILQPGGYHLMLLGLKEPLKAGTKLPVTLTFEKAAPLSVEIDVKSRGAAAGKPAADDGGHSDHQH